MEVNLRAPSCEWAAMTRNTFLKSMLRTGIGSAVLLDRASGQPVKSSAETAATLENRQLALRVFGNGTFALHFGRTMKTSGNRIHGRAWRVVWY